MLQINLSKNGATVVSIEKSATIENVGVATFSDSSKAAFSLKLDKSYITADGVPLFCNPDTGVMNPAYEVQNRKGTNWIQDTRVSNNEKPY